MIRIVEIALVGSAGKPDALPEPSLPEVAFAGRSNVGKSSLLNALVGRRGLFKVSSTPGRTRKIYHAEARLSDGRRLYVVDLPGYGYAKMSKAALRAWAHLLEGYLSDRPTLALVVLLVDARRGLEEEEEQLVDFLFARDIPVVLVATKIDRLKKSERKLVLEALHRRTGVRALATSAEDRTGVDELCDFVARCAGERAK